MEKKYPVAHTPITVNVDDWLAQRQHVEPQDLEIARQAAQTQVEEWRKRNERMERESLLSETSTECSECGNIERPYKDDYMCYVCRDKLG